MDPALLLPAVREVSILVDPERPTAITQRAFDAARARSVVPNLPRAKRIVESLNAKRRDKHLTWAGVLALAHAKQQERTKTVSTQEAGKPPRLSERQIVDALIFVSIRLGTKAFTRETYEYELHKMRKEGVPVNQLRLPSGQQIVRALARKLRQREDAWAAGLRLPRASKEKSATTVKTVSKLVRRKRWPISKENAWKAALEMAGLQQVERAYLPSPSVSTVELLEKCFASHKTQLTRDEARKFIHANNIQYSDAHQELNWGESVAQWKKSLEARGIVPPVGPPARDQRPDYSLNVGAGHPDTKTRRIGWTDIDACLADVCAYLEQLPAGGHSFFAGFQLWLEAQGRAPISRSAFAKHGGWSHVRQLAYKRLYPGLEVEAKAHERKHRVSIQNQASTGKPHAKTMQVPRDMPSATEAREITPEPRPLEPADRLRALNFRSPYPKRRRAPRRNPSPLI